MRLAGFISTLTVSAPLVSPKSLASFAPLASSLYKSEKEYYEVPISRDSNIREPWY